MNVLLANICPICGLSFSGSRLPICDKCFAIIQSETPLHPFTSEKIPVIRSCRAYNGITEKCLKQFKYHGKKSVCLAFKKTISECFSKTLFTGSEIDLIIPVPVSVRRYRLRGYNQSFLLAKMLSDILHTPVRSRYLIKVKNTPSQTGLSKKKRIENLEGSFLVKKNRDIAAKSVLLVDDIITTGATLDTCAGELFRHGVQKITAFTIARTL